MAQRIQKNKGVLRTGDFIWYITTLLAILKEATTHAPPGANVGLIRDAARTSFNEKVLGWDVIKPTDPLESVLVNKDMVKKRHESLEFTGLVKYMLENPTISRLGLNLSEIMDLPYAEFESVLEAVNQYKLFKAKEKALEEAGKKSPSGSTESLIADQIAALKEE